MDWKHLIFRHRPDEEAAQHMEQARQHKMHADRHDEKAEGWERGLKSYHPLAGLFAGHHRKLSREHKRQQGYHEGKVNEIQKRDSEGRWAASMAENRHHKLYCGPGSSRRARYLARQGAACGIGGMVPKGDVVKKVGDAIAGGAKAVVKFAGPAAATAFWAWLMIRGIKASVEGSIVTMENFATGVYGDIAAMVSGLKGIFTKKPPAASLSGPPKYHQLYEGLSMSGGGSRKARYLARKGMSQGTSPGGQVPNDEEAANWDRDHADMSFSVL